MKRIRVIDLYAAYLEWATAPFSATLPGGGPLTLEGFTDHILSRPGIGRTTIDGVAYFRGIGLNALGLKYLANAQARSEVPS